MRIIGGRLSGQKFEPPRNFAGRPTTDFAREALFNILNNKLDFNETSVLDLFAGTGAFSYECFSRGSQKILSLDNHVLSARFIPAMFTKFEMTKATFIKADVMKYLSNATQKFDLIFADPPYDFRNLTDIPTLVFDNHLLATNGLMILEHSKANSFKKYPNFMEERKYGSVHFSFFRNSQP